MKQKSVSMFFKSMKCSLLFSTMAFYLFITIPSKAEDLRVVYATNSYKTAQSCDKACSLLKEGKPKEAIIILEEVVKLEPDSSGAFRAYLSALIDAGEGDRALLIGVDNFNTLFKAGRYTESYSVASILAKHAMIKEKWDSAELWGSKAIISLIKKTVPSPVEDAGMLARMLALVGKSQAKQGKSVEAVMNFLSSQAAAPGHVDQKELLSEAKQVPLKVKNRHILLPFDGGSASLSSNTPSPSIKNVSLELDKSLSEHFKNLPEITHIENTTTNAPIILVSADGASYKVKGISIERIATNGTAKCADACLNNIFTGYSTPDKIEERNFEGALVGTTALQNAPMAITAFPLYEMLFSIENGGRTQFCSTRFDALRIVSPFPASAIAADRLNGFLYTAGHADGTSQGKDGKTESGSVTLSKFDVGRSGFARTEIGLGSAFNTNTVAVNAGGGRIALSSGDSSSGKTISSVLVFDSNNLGEFKDVEHADDGTKILNIVFSPSDRLLVVRTDRLMLLNTNTLENISIRRSEGTFSGAAGFSSSGDILYAAVKNGGVDAYLVKGEGNPIITNTKKATPDMLGDIVSTIPPLKQIPELSKFTPSKNEAVVKAAAKTVIDNLKDNFPPDWKCSNLYDPLRCWTVSSKMCLLDPSEAKKYLAEEIDSSPSNAGIAAAYGEFLGATGDAGAEPALIKAVRLDQGRTSATTISLWRLGQILSKQGRDIEAACCLSNALSIDGFNPSINKTAKMIFKRLRWSDCVDKLPTIQERMYK